MEAGRPLFIPVILWYSQNGPYEPDAAQLVTGELGKCSGVETDLIEIARHQSYHPDAQRRVPPRAET